ncbi:serologically defined colon cancer antigen 8 homolog [Polymixia lowei]
MNNNSPCSLRQLKSSMKPLDSDEEEEQLGAYQKELRERANRSIQQLSSVLTLRSPDGEEVEGDRSSPGSPDSPTAGEEEAAWTQRSQSEAVNQLKSLLLKQHKDASSPLSPSKRRSPSKVPQEEGTSSVTDIHDLVPIIYNQSEYIQHLEAEVKFCKEEVQGLKQRVRVVVVENEKLQSELKSKMADETLKDFTILDSTVNQGTAAKGQIASKPVHSMPERVDNHAWKNELAQLKELYQAQTETLEAQVMSLRKELSVSQKECEEVKARLRHREAQAAETSKVGGAPRVAGLCLKCAQHEAVLAGTHTNMHVQAIDRLTKERDELMVALRAVRTSQQEAQQREWSACMQVKQAVEMAEEANLHKTRVEVQCEQLSRELGRQRERLDREAQALQERLAEAREEARCEARKEKEELAHTVSSMSQRVAELQGQLDRTNREMSSLTNQLDDALRKLTNQEQDSTKVCVDLRYQLSHAHLKREEAERQLRELANKITRLTEKSAQEVERLSSELVGCRQRLEAVQKDESQWQAEALSLAEQLANAQRQLHLTRQEREIAGRAHEDDMAAATTSAREKERELILTLEQTEAWHEQRVGELDGLLSSQNSLIRKLKEECCMLGAKLEEWTESSRSELEQLSLEKVHLEETVERLRARCSDMEEQCVQHGCMHQRMKDRLQQLDRHCQTSAQQVCELLAKQNQLMQERHTLTEEMQNLRIELPNTRRVATLST